MSGIRNNISDIANRYAIDIQHGKIDSPVLCSNDLNILKSLQKDDSIVVSRLYKG